MTSLIASSGLAQEPAATAAPIAPNPDEIFPDNLIYEGIVVDSGRVLARKDGEFITQLTPRMTAYNGPMPP